MVHNLQLLVYGECLLVRMPLVYARSEIESEHEQVLNDDPRLNAKFKLQID